MLTLLQTPLFSRWSLPLINIKYLIADSFEVEQTAGQVEKTGCEQNSADTPRDQRYAAQPVVTAVRKVTLATAAHHVTFTAARHVTLTAALHVTLTAAHHVTLTAAHHVTVTAAHHVTLTAAPHVALTAYAVSLTVTAVLACIFLGAVLDGDIFILIPASIVAFVIDTDTFVTGKNIAAGIVVTCQNVIITTFIFTMV